MAKPKFPAEPKSPAEPRSATKPASRGKARAATAPDLSELFDAAAKARGNAHAPYSRFRVGAALRSVEGGVFAGCNVENAAYPVGTCAEAGAVAAMVAAGHRRIVEAIVIGDSRDPVTPCGACRQRLREFAGPDVPVHCATIGGAHVTYSLAALLPASFGPGHLAGGVEASRSVAGETKSLD